MADKLELRQPTHSRAPSISGSVPESPSPTPAGAIPEGTPSNQSDNYDKSTFEPEEEIEILVGGQVLPFGMTIATARSYYWKQGGDLILSYRLKKKMM